jgi:hypothetical protein
MSQNFVESAISGGVPSIKLIHNKTLTYWSFSYVALTAIHAIIVIDGNPAMDGINKGDN